MATEKKQPSKTKVPETNAQQERTWAMLTHLSAFAGLVFPFGNIVGPLVVWLLKRDEFPAIDAHGKEALNFQISVTIYYIVSAVLILIIIGIPLILAVMILQIVCIILATLKANAGEMYQYPFSIRFIK